MIESYRVSALSVQQKQAIHPLAAENQGPNKRPAGLRFFNDKVQSCSLARSRKSSDAIKPAKKRLANRSKMPILVKRNCIGCHKTLRILLYVQEMQHTTLRAHFVCFTNTQLCNTRQPHPAQLRPTTRLCINTLRNSQLRSCATLPCNSILPKLLVTPKARQHHPAQQHTCATAAAGKKTPPATEPCASHCRILQQTETAATSKGTVRDPSNILPGTRRPQLAPKRLRQPATCHSSQHSRSNSLQHMATGPRNSGVSRHRAKIMDPSNSALLSSPLPK